MGQQRWQRALVRLLGFRDSDLAWSVITWQKNVLLEEQAIGDAMMFFFLIPELMRISGFVAIYVSKRLVSIYKRTFASDIAKQRFAVYKPDIVSGLCLLMPLIFKVLSSSCQYVFNFLRNLPGHL